MTSLRIEVEGPDGGCIVTVDTSILDRLTDQQLAEVRDAAALATESLSDLGYGDPLTLVLAELARWKADIAAYEREAQRRGVLPL